MATDTGSVCCFLEQETFTPQKVLVIPRNRWLRLSMTEKLFTGTLNKNQNKKETKLNLSKKEERERSKRKIETFSEFLKSRKLAKLLAFKSF